MKFYALCPVSGKKINERVARLNALFTVLLLILFFITHSVIPVLFLGIDFLFRATEYSRFSLIRISSERIARYLTFQKVYINAGPKIFAARIGLFLSGLILFFIILDFPVAAVITGGILALFSFLEAAFGLCVACEIYPLVYRLFYRKADE